MNKLYNTYMMDWSPYSTKTTQVPPLDIKSSEYVYTCVLNAVKMNIPFTVIRMGDGEAGLMNFHKTGRRPGWMTTEWCNKLGITDSSDENCRNIGRMLIETANNTDFLGSSIWGSSHSLESWNIDPFINRPSTKPRCSNWFNLEWMADGCAHNLVMTCSFGVLHNSPDTEQILRNSLGKDPRFKGQMKPSGHFILQGNHQKAEDFIKNSDFDVYLISGGPYGKVWMYEMSRKYNKVMLDIGHAMTRCWARPDGL